MVHSPDTEQVAERALLVKAQESPHAGFHEKKEAQHDVQRPESTWGQAQAGREDGQVWAAGRRGAGEQTGSRGGKRHTLIRASLQELKWESVPHESMLGDQ